jgi:hypothetical protein
VSNSNNLGKELARLRKEFDALQNKDRRFHFLVLTPGESEAEKLKQLIAAGTMDVGDEYQVVQIPWKISPLIGSSHIPESGGADPYAEPELPPEPVFTTSWTEKREREARWADHVKKIERDGERYEGDKPKDTTWR